jgi:hypothetical protein
MESEKTTLVLGDLTALFAIRSMYRKSINYQKLDSALKRVLEASAFDTNIWYTLFRQDNDKQASFIQGLRDIGWDIETVASREVKRLPDTRNYRFDSRIAYQIGLACESYDRIVVVSDSYELHAPLMQLLEDDPNIEIGLAFFSDALDGRWWKAIRSEGSRISFIDLDEELANERDLEDEARENKEEPEPQE